MKASFKNSFVWSVLIVACCQLFCMWTSIFDVPYAWKQTKTLKIISIAHGKSGNNCEITVSEF